MCYTAYVDVVLCTAVCKANKYVNNVCQCNAANSSFSAKSNRDWENVVLNIIVGAA